MLRCPIVVDLPVHSESAFVNFLHAVHANVPIAMLKASGDHLGQCNVLTAVFRPAFNNRNFIQIDLLFG